MNRLFKRLTGAICLIASAVFAMLAWRRAQLPYNDLGRYFDPAANVVYDEQAVLVWGGIALLLGVLGIASLLAGRS